MSKGLDEAKTRLVTLEEEARTGGPSRTQISTNMHTQTSEASSSKAQARVCMCTNAYILTQRACVRACVRASAYMYVYVCVCMCMNMFTYNSYTLVSTDYVFVDSFICSHFASFMFTNA